LAAAHGGWWDRHWLDLLLALVLGAVAFLVRRHGLPTDGLWLDDSITAAGLDASSPSELLAVGAEHPGFIAFLNAWGALSGGGDAVLAYPALIAGTLGPPLLYLALRWAGPARSVSLLLGAVLVIAQTDIVYSGRVRGYTIDLLIVLAVAMILPRLTRIEWRWPTAVAWIAATFVLATFSIFAMIAVAAAGVIVLLHPTRDVWVRGVAVGAQAAATGALFAAERATYDSSNIEDAVEEQFDAFVAFDANPIRFGEEILLHLRRVAETFTGSSEWLAVVCVLAALAGLAAVAIRGPNAVRARYLWLIVAVALAGGLLGKFPFGPAEGNPLSDGRRWSIWLIPVIAVGLAFVLERIRELLAGHAVWRIGFDAVAVAGAAVILVVAGRAEPGAGFDVSGPALRYPFPGANSASDYVESELGPRDVLLIPFRSNWSFAAESDFEATVKRTPESSVGFVPDFLDPRVHYVGLEVGVPQVSGAVEDSERVFVYYAQHPFNESEVESKGALAASLGELGFAPQRADAFGSATVEVWRRGGTGAWLQSEQPPSGLPRGVRRSPQPHAVTAVAMLRCLDVSTADAKTSAFSYSGLEKTVVGTELIIWPNRATAREALYAFNAPDAADCVGSPVESYLEAGEVQASAEVNRAQVPRAAGAAAVAFRQIIDPASAYGGSKNLTLLFFTRGRAGVLIIATVESAWPAPSKVLSDFIADAEGQLKVAAATSR
jgi:hypothetical protein